MLKTLIVDDEKLVRKGFISIIPWELYGMQVAGEAANGEKALEFIRNNKVDLLITDLSMPVMSGFDLMKSVRLEYPHIWIVVLSCHLDFKFVQEALRLGAIDYIVKTELDTIEDDIKRITERIRRGQAEKLTPLKTALNCEADELLIAGQGGRHKYSDEVVNSIINAITYIKNNLHTGVNQDDVAKKVNMSRGYFSQCFKDIVGKPFVDYVRDLAMQKAVELLLQTGNPIYMIADQLGYKDEKYFSRVFREAMGLSPTEYRSRNAE